MGSLSAKNESEKFSRLGTFKIGHDDQINAFQKMLQNMLKQQKLFLAKNVHVLF